MEADREFRIATWNIDHARARSRDADRIAIIDSADADVLILTETSDRVRPTAGGFRAAHSAPRPHCPPAERWVSIWTRVPIRKHVDTIDPLRTVAVVLGSDDHELLVYGTVLPWHADVGDARAQPAPRHWAEHRRVVAEQSSEWKALHDQMPGTPLIVAGDWNTDLLAGSGTTPRPYGLSREVRLIEETMTALRLDVPTRGVADPCPQRSFLIEHVAVPSGNTAVTTLAPVSRRGAALSDHPLVAVDVSFAD